MVTLLLWLLTSLLPEPCSPLPSFFLTLDLVVGMGRHIVGGSEPWILAVETINVPTRI
jgi:hypothetical protein